MTRLVTPWTVTWRSREDAERIALRLSAEVLPVRVLPFALKRWAVHNAGRIYRDGEVASALMASRRP